MDLTQLLLSPVRVRVMQYLQAKGEATTKQIAGALPDVTVSSLYRHINILLEEGLLAVKEERRVRGSLERLLTIDTQRLTKAIQGDFAAVAYQFLMGLYGQFQKYSQRKDADPERDMLLLSTCVLMLSDEAYGSLLQEIGGVLEKYLKNEDREKGRARSLSLVSAPAEENENEK